MKHKEWYLKEVMPLLNEIKILENRINTSISFIESLKEPITGEVYLLDNERTELIDILTGNEKVLVKRYDNKKRT